ncbi:MAG: tRNA 4-thiouridine(8) synthase ThiI, partial [Candidatus Helarchaeota archaeon]|nr:tRNA 4-thiouridine(8) synthase ThiI [Candidatus Helarchaeota archaeon]
STKVRRNLENILSTCILQMLQREKIGYEKLKLIPTRGRLFIYTEELTRAMEVLKKCFGIVSLSPAFQIETDRKAIQEAALQMADASLTMNGSFAIQTKRTGQHPFTSQDISAEVGAFILDNLAERKIKVNLTNPDHKIYIEIRDKEAFLFDKIVYGTGGLPYGSQGKAVALISGGIDSPVASWLMMKRGCKIFPIFADLVPYTTIAATDRLIQVLRKLYEYTPHQQVTFYQFPHGEYLEQVKEFIPPKLTCIFCKRMMYKVAEKLALSLNAKAIVTGENLGQVASQTLDNLYILDQATQLPVFRPLIGFDKNEITDLSRKLDLYTPSIMQVPSCTAVSQYPETHGALDKILKIEQEHDFDRISTEQFEKIKKIKVPLHS